MLWIASAVLRLFARARAGAFAVDPRRPAIPVPARAVVEHGVAKPVGLALGSMRRAAT